MEQLFLLEAQTHAKLLAGPLKRPRERKQFDNIQKDEERNPHILLKGNSRLLRWFRQIWESLKSISVAIWNGKS